VVQGFCDVMRSWLKSRLDDPWEGGGRIDVYLSSGDRAMVGRLLTEDTKSSAQAEEYRKSDKTEKAFERWNAVFPKGPPSLRLTSPPQPSWQPLRATL
jgi:hypothetical protein